MLGNLYIPTRETVTIYHLLGRLLGRGQSCLLMGCTNTGKRKLLNQFCEDSCQEFSTRFTTAGQLRGFLLRCERGRASVPLAIHDLHLARSDAKTSSPLSLLREAL